MVYPSSTYTPVKKESSDNKPSWAFDVSKSLPKASTSLQDSYRIPFPQSSVIQEEDKIPFLCTRIFLVICNLIFFLIGISMVIMAILAAAKPTSCAYCFAVLRPLLIAGMLTSFISSIGLFGAFFNSYKMLLVYVTCVVFLLMIQMIVFFWSLFGRCNFHRRLHGYFTQKMRSNPHDLVALLELIQSDQQCCGVNGPLDYHSAGLQVPRSCCSSAKGFDCNADTFVVTVPPVFNATEPTVNVTTEAANITSNDTMGASTPRIEELLSDVTKARRKRSAVEFTQQTTPRVSISTLLSISTGPPSPSVGPDSGTDEHFATNISVNTSFNATLPPDLFDMTNITGGPEQWDIHHVKTNGCFRVVWSQWEKNKYLMVGVVFAEALFLSLQFVILCMSHRLARGGFIYENA